MKKEQALEKRTKILLSKKGWDVYHVASIPGFPDSLIMKGPRYGLIEFKVLKKKDQALKTLFQKDQPPRLYELTFKSPKPVFVVIQELDLGFSFVRMEPWLAQMLPEMVYSGLTEFPSYRHFWKLPDLVSALVDEIEWRQE